jgi:hypothetical protein
MTRTQTPEALRQERWVATYCQRHPAADWWAAGCGRSGTRLPAGSSLSTGVPGPISFWKPRGCWAALRQSC